MNSEHQYIKDKFLEETINGLKDVDNNCLFQKQTKTRLYEPGLKGLDEIKILSLLKDYLGKNLPNHFDSKVLVPIKEQSYRKKPELKCDIVVRIGNYFPNLIQLDSELKILNAIGENGEEYQNWPNRMFQFYDDGEKLNKYSTANIKLLLGVTYSYDEKTFEYMKNLHPKHKAKFDILGNFISNKGGKFDLMRRIKTIESDLIDEGIMNQKFDMIPFFVPKHPYGGRATLVVGQIN
jgi:hypothetical protein